MPKPTLESGQTFLGPPVSVISISRDLYDYLLMVHQIMFSLDPNGSGTLDGFNVARALAADNADSATSATTANSSVVADSALTTDHGNSTNVTTYQHHGVGLHKDLDQAVALADTATIISTAVWAVNTDYVVGNYVTNNGNVYICIVSGKSAAAGGPMAISSAIIDNTATWDYICTARLKDTVNTVITDYIALKANLRTAKVLAT